jgi:hypothetical protein
MPFVLCEIATGRLRPLVGNLAPQDALAGIGIEAIEVDQIPEQLSAYKGVNGEVVAKSQSELNAEAEAAALAEYQLKIMAIKQEANRRIVAICPEWKQRNLTAQAAQLAKKGEANWTQAETDAWAAGEALWAQIAAIRVASDAIEAMDPMPDEITADNLWP